MNYLSLVVIPVLFVSQAYGFELPSQEVKAYNCETCAHLSHKDLADHWNIKKFALDKQAPHSQKSYSYKKKVTLEQLQKGVLIPTQAPGAILRITALEDKTIPSLMLQTPQNKILNLKEASSLYSEDALFGDASLSAKHQTMMQINKDLAHGTFILKSIPSTDSNAKQYLINVFDKFSSTYLEAESKAMHYQYGDQFTATIHFNMDSSDYEITQIDAYLNGPKNQSIPLTPSKTKKNEYQISALLNSETNDIGENWYLDASVVAENKEAVILRNVHLAFSYSIPSAAIYSIKKSASNPLAFDAIVKVATASRYSLSSVLFKKDKQGALLPLELSQSGSWLEPGLQVIQFSFDNNKQLEEDTLYLGYFKLIDYGQFKPVYQYNRAIELPKLMD